MNRDLKKMSRLDLIDIISQYQIREQKLIRENENLRKQLDEHMSKIASAGSIAEAALALNNVFEAAQAAADQYLSEIQFNQQSAIRYADSIIADAWEKARMIEETAKKDYETFLKQTESGIRPAQDESPDLIDAQRKSER